MAEPSNLPADDLTTPPSPSRARPILIVSGLSLLALGAALNAERLSLAVDELRADRSASVEEWNEEPPPAEESEEFEHEAGSGTVHRGEEGKMGQPSSKSKSGLYAMKGPANAVPQMARGFDPNLAARQAGILGVMGQGSGQYLASPYGGAYAVGNDDEDVWGGLTGTEVGEAYGVGGLGLVGTGRGGGGGVGDGQLGFNNRADRNRAGERYAAVAANVFIPTSKDPKSTFSIDVDTASYANTRRYLLESNLLPPPDAVRTEELVNYFDYDYVRPGAGGAPFSVTTEVGPSPWTATNRLVHVGIQGAVPPADATPPRNLVFLLDVSGSMSSADKLPLVKHGLASLTEQLGPQDRVSIVVYAGAAGAVLEPTSGADQQKILGALDRLESGGSTNGAEGIELAYELAERTFVKGGINRVILASDGDFNVGMSDTDALIELIEQKRKSGVFLSILGVGTGNLNDHMMEQLADKGNGNYAYLDGMLEARKVLVEQAGSTLHTIAKDVKIQVEFDPDQVAQHRLVGYENRVLAHRDFDDDSKDAGEIGAGHSVTAIYEIVPTPAALEAAGSAPLMTLNLRYKQPDEDRSRKLSTPVVDSGETLADASTDYRFSAAVAAFSEALRGTHDELRYGQILDLAAGSLGADEHCYRHQFLDMVWQAGTLAGEDLAKPESQCTPGQGSERPNRTVIQPLIDSEQEYVTVVHEHEHEHRPEWMSFMLEVLRLLPPLLALPLFVLAYRRPRRRR